MKQKTLGRWLKGTILAVGAVGLLVCLAVVPVMGMNLKEKYPEFAHCFWPWMVFILLTALPCFGMLVQGWKIAENIGNDRSFTMVNARLLKWIAVLSAGDAAFFFGGNIVLWLMNMSHPGVVLASLSAVLVGAVVAVAAASLSHLVQKAAALQEQSDWTI